MLLHFKFMADFIDRAQVEARAQAILAGRQAPYRVQPATARMQPIDFRCELTERFRSTGQLVELGLMRTSPALDDARR